MDNNGKYLSNIYELVTYKQLFTKPTRVAPNPSFIINHIATTSPKSIAKSGVLPTSMGDHFMVFSVRKFEGGLLQDYTMIKPRRIKNFNKQMFLLNVANINWVKALDQRDDINVLVSNWSKLFSYVVKKHAPFKRCMSQISTAPATTLILGHIINLEIS